LVAPPDGINPISNQASKPKRFASRQKKSGGLWDTIKTVIYAILIALAVRTIAYEPFNIPSESMVPTLLVGDYLFVSKFSYGYSRYSLPLGLPLIPGRVFFTPPKRGDVVVFKLPRDNETDYIKRIIGVPGDKIQMREGRLYINDKLVERERVEDYLARDEMTGTVVRRPHFIETLPGGKKHDIIEIMGDNGPLDNTPVYEVPPDHYFAMGDNRDNSLDSRVPPNAPQPGVGYIPKENLVGRAEFLFFSTDGSAALWEFWKWPSSLRIRRFFTGIH
jgi:signal peptidase I